MEKEKRDREDLQPIMKKARMLAWFTIAYLLFDVTILFFAMQNSQAMKASWIEDMLYLIPSVSFLISSRISEKPPDKRFRFGYDSAYSVGFLMSSVALFAVGCYIFIDSVLKFVKQDVVSISSIEVFGHTIWFGWIMILAIGYSILPVYLIGKKKMKLAGQLNVQILYADAKGQKADWMTSVATIVGVLGMGMGIWWMDAAAAILISLDILSDGYRSLRSAVAETMDRVPLNAFLHKEEPLVKEIEDLVGREAWIQDFLVRLRKAGNKTTGEVLLVTQEDENLQQKIFALDRKIREYHWEITNITVSPVEKIPELKEKK